MSERHPGDGPRTPDATVVAQWDNVVRSNYPESYLIQMLFWSDGSVTWRPQPPHHLEDR